ncbi:enoyl-CoA hydratase [Corynebacterium halotolerans]|uniref:Enoyl-CoA hydratase n=1 Tax=Corynebacterium halotolerans YIM 70093 = DSM 44683 TaxID=1121362 RepID=M1MXT8_9CORY|nr:enoyl-CoA hydratase [Corynebacterium halotolerans]AGF72549.1 enoyl-CoA hydratase [Corynebacterium halotolerans YIM 70093 = DSM 44683]
MTHHLNHADPADQPLVLAEDQADGHLRLLTLNRHVNRNCLNIPMCEAIDQAMLQAVADGARVVLLQGGGTVFSSGADLSGGVYAEGFYETLLHMLGTIQTLPIPVIAWVNGPAIGAGTQLAMACDMRVVSDTAYFRVPIGDMAIALDEVTIANLENLVGGSLARTMLFTGASLSHQQALASGFAVAEDGFDEALSLAELVAAKAPLTLRHLKYEFSRTSHRPYDKSTREGVAAAAWHSADVEESRIARAEKRSPRFTGR